LPANFTSALSNCECKERQAFDINGFSGKKSKFVLQKCQRQKKGPKPLRLRAESTKGGGGGDTVEGRFAVLSDV
jgi:hypothetical protein